MSAVKYSSVPAPPLVARDASGVVKPPRPVSLADLHPDDPERRRLIDAMIELVVEENHELLAELAK